jgi:AraC family transcriptional regulator
MQRESVRQWPGMRSEYAWLPPHDGATVTGAGQIGVAFTGHHRLARTSGGRIVEADVAPGSAVISGTDPITWLRVREMTEALEIYPDPALLAAMAARWASRPVEVEQHVGHRDGVVLGVASILRRAHTAGSGLTDVAASTLAHRLVAHLLSRYAGVPVPVGRGHLSPGAVDRVAEVVEESLGRTLTLDELASAAHLSPYHFNRVFRRTTGMAPYAFVTSRRMDRARLLLSTTRLPVDEVASRVGFGNLSHFRRTFRRHHGVAPSALRH